MKNTILYLNEPDENVLIDRCQNNDSVAQHMLFNKYSSQVMAICVRYLKDREEAFAAMNQVFLKVFQNIKTFKRETKLQAWINRIAVNYLIDEIRRSKKYKKSFIKVDEFSFYGEPQDEDTSIESSWDKAMEIPQQVLLEMIA
ncbi:MAG: RNA polymerase sigma factor, partial [Bacteroidia bacterium]